MNVDLNIGDLYDIKRGLIRSELYWTRTRRKDVTASERTMTIVSIREARKKIEAAISDWEAKEKTRNGRSDKS